MKPKLEVQWLDYGREPQCAPDPLYPEGIDIDMSAGRRGCFTALPYPAQRCGAYHVRCLRCGITTMVTTAGRPDDPRSIKLRCRPSA